jgi:hypothetical protein
MPLTQFLNNTIITTTYAQQKHGQSSVFHILTRLVHNKSDNTHPHVNLQLVMNPKANKSVCCYGYNIYRARIKCLKKCQEWVPHIKTRKKVHMNIYPQFPMHSPTASWTQSFRFLPVPTLKNVGTFSFNYKETLQRIFSAHQTIPNRPGTIARCNSPLSDIRMHAWTLVEDIFSMCCELWLIKQQEFRSLNWECVFQMYSVRCK